MSLGRLLALVAVAAGQKSHDIHAHQRVVGGYAAPEGTYPWIVSLYGTTYCADSDGVSGSDDDGEICGYYSRYPSDCGAYGDDWDLFANSMCCACGGGTSHSGFSATTHSCGGSLIAADWVLTAAHCFDFASPETFTSSNALWIGGWNSRAPSSANGAWTPELKTISEVYVHPWYDSSDCAQSSSYDVMLLKLSSSSSLTPVNLASTTPSAGTDLKVIGWGNTEGKTYASSAASASGTDDPGENDDGWGYDDGTGTHFYPYTLREVVVPVIDDAACTDGSWSITPDVEICAGFASGGKDSCQGDSGGPLFSFDSGGAIEQVGVVSWGYGCAEAGFYGVYADVAWAYDWISSIMAQTSCADASDCSTNCECSNAASRRLTAAVPEPLKQQKNKQTPLTTRSTASQTGGGKHFSMSEVNKITRRLSAKASKSPKTTLATKSTPSKADGVQKRFSLSEVNKITRRRNLLFGTYVDTFAPADDGESICTCTTGMNAYTPLDICP